MNWDGTVDVGQSPSACWVFSFSTFKISLLVAMFMTLGGENQSRLLGVQVYFVLSKSRVVSVIHWNAIVHHVLIKHSHLAGLLESIFFGLC